MPTTAKNQAVKATGPFAKAKVSKTKKSTSRPAVAPKHGADASKQRARLMRDYLQESATYEPPPFGNWKRSRTPEERARSRGEFLAELDHARAAAIKEGMELLDIEGVRAEVRRRRGSRR